MLRVLALAAVLTFGVALPAGAQTAPEPESSSGGGPANTLTGRCSYAGPLVFERPIGGVPEQNSMWFATRGSCSGFLDGRRIDDEPVRFWGFGSGLMSCEQGLPNGPGALAVGDAVIPFTFSELRVTGGGKTRFAGSRGGSLDGVGATSDDPAELVERCLANAVERVSIYGEVAGTISG